MSRIFFLQWMTANNVNCLKTWVYLWQYFATWIIINLHDIGCCAIRHHRERLYIQRLQPSRARWEDVASDGVGIGSACSASQAAMRRRQSWRRRTTDGGRKKRKASDGAQTKSAADWFGLFGVGLHNCWGWMAGVAAGGGSGNGANRRATASSVPFKRTSFEYLHNLFCFSFSVLCALPCSRN